MISAFITALTPIVLLASLGALLAKKTSYLDNPQLGSLVSNVGLPALLLSAVLNMEMDLKLLPQRFAAWQVWHWSRSSS